MGELWRRIWYLLNRSRFERELREEMAAHADMKGSAGPRFGNTLRLREESGDVWGWAWLDRFTQDVRFGARLLARTPLFTLTAAFVLALGVGVNLAAFEVLDALAFRWLPVASPEALVKVENAHPRGRSTSFSYPAFDYYRANAAPFSSTFGLVYGDVTIDRDDTRHVSAEFVTGNYFADLGARPLIGRLLMPDDDRPGASPVAVLSERFWQSRFGGDAGLIGRTLAVNGQPVTVIGVAPAAFVGLHDDAARLWMPVTQHAAAYPGSSLLVDANDKGAVRVYARLRAGTTIAQAQAALAPLPRTLHDLRPEAANADEWLDLLPGGHYLTLDQSSAAGIALALALVLLVLVAACMNLGLLVLSRALLRDREFSIRLSVGASRPRILRQLMTEYLLLSAIGAAAACVVASLATRALAAFTEMPNGLAPHFSLRSAGATVCLALLSCLLFGLTPAVQAIRPAASRRLRARGVLIGVQVAAASVLLIVSALTVRGITHVARAPLGFDYRRMLTVDPNLGSHGIDPSQADAYWTALATRLRDVPGTVDTAITTLPPFGNRLNINAEQTVFYGVTPSYFAAMGIPLQRGRLFDRHETKVAIVSESLARRRWPDGNALGQLYEGATVIGVAGDARSVRIGDRSTSECYTPITDDDLPQSVMVVRVAGDPSMTVRAVMGVARGLDPRLSPAIEVLPDALDRRLESARQFTVLAAVLGTSALLLAVIGLAGMVAFTLSQRLREIGVRLALGAAPRHVAGAIASQFVRPVAAGAIAGSLLAGGVGVILSSELFGISGLDPIAHGGALLLFALVSSAAVLPSIRRALRIDPAATLRHE
jgi:predicted permease